jgi:hypothetical protein
VWARVDPVAREDIQGKMVAVEEILLLGLMCLMVVAADAVAMPMALEE